MYLHKRVKPLSPLNAVLLLIGTETPGEGLEIRTVKKWLSMEQQYSIC